MRARSPGVVGLLVGLVVLFGAIASLALAGTRRHAPSLRVTPTSGHAGTWVWVSGSHFRPYGAGIVDLGGRWVASFRAGRHGRFRVGFLIPADEQGTVNIEATLSVRGRRGSLRRLQRTATRFRVLVGGSGGAVGFTPPAGGGGTGAGDGGANGSGPGVTPVGPGAPATPSTKAPGAGSTGSGSTGAGTTGGGSTGGGSTGGGTTSGGSTEGGSTSGGSTGGGSTGSRWVAPKNLTWYWQLQGTVDNDEPVAAYDIDGFENTAAEVSALHGQGKHVICYIDVGTFEPGRSDESSFPLSVRGSEVQGWPGEHWLDIADLSVLEPIMSKRFEMCHEKGFDAVEPDNMDGYENDSGFPLTAAQQLTYDEWVASEVHSLDMAVLQKNDGGQTTSLEPHFDGALTEECNVYSECSDFTPYLSAGKPVLNAEYGSSTAFCAADNAAGIMGVRYDLELDGKTFEPCW